MYKIYTFLQKKKMHESQLGIYMVITAYVLSFLMLIIGSDTFYNINSSAAGVNNDTDEVTKEMPDKDIFSPRIMDLKKQVLITNDLSSADILPATEDEISNTVPDDTNWLLGYALNSEEYDSLMEKMDEITFLEDEQEPEEASIESFSAGQETDSGVLDVTKEERDMLEHIVEAEASGEDMVGKILIVNVIINRMKDKEFPDSIKGVIYQKVDGDYQFSPLADKRFWTVKVSDKSRKAVLRALEGEDYSEGALYFMSRKRTKKSSARWFDQNLEWLFKHGGHEFYKNK